MDNNSAKEEENGRNNLFTDIQDIQRYAIHLNIEVNNLLNLGYNVTILIVLFSIVTVDLQELDALVCNTIAATIEDVFARHPGLEVAYEEDGMVFVKMSDWLKAIPWNANCKLLFWYMYFNCVL